MLLVELWIRNTLYRVSNEELPLTHLWMQYVDSGFTAPSYRTRTDYGGFCELTFGLLPLLPDLFENDWPPPVQCRCNVYYTSSTEAAKTSLFDGYAHLKSYGRESVTYDLYTQIPAVPLLGEIEDYDGNTVPIPMAVGAVSHVQPLRLPDDGDGYPVYCLSGLDTSPAKHGSEIFNINRGTAYDPTGDAAITCASHPFNTGESVTIEGFGGYDGSYTITDHDANTVDLNISFVNIGYDISITVSRTSGAGSLNLYMGVAPIPSNPISNGGYGTYFKAQGNGYFKISKDTLWAGTISQILINPSAGGDYLIDRADLLASEVWTVGSGWAVSSTGGISATAGTASDLIYNAYEFEYYVGQLFKAGMTMLYDDGVPIPENLSAIDAETFTLTASPVGQLTLSGINPDIETLKDLFEWACEEDRLCCYCDTTMARTPSPAVNFWADSQSVLLDFLSDVCSWNTHLFYFKKDTMVGTEVYLGSSKYLWELSGNGTSEYHLTNADGTNPYKRRPDILKLNSVSATELTAGFLTAGTWAYGDNDTLGYDTIYVRLSDGTDPDTKSDSYVKAEYHDVLYLVAMEAANGTRSVTEFDYFNANYETPPPVKSLSSGWVMRNKIEDTNGIRVAETSETEKILNYPYGSEESLTPYDYTKSTIKTRIEAIRTYKNRAIITASIPLWGTTPPQPGEKITLPDTSLVADTESEFYVRSIQYDFDNDEFKMSGEGTIIGES